MKIQSFQKISHTSRRCSNDETFFDDFQTLCYNIDAIFVRKKSEAWNGILNRNDAAERTVFCLFFNICSSDQKGKKTRERRTVSVSMQIFTRISSWSFRYILLGRHRLNLINCLSTEVRKQKIPWKNFRLSLSRANVSRARGRDPISPLARLSTIALKQCSENLHICYLLSQSNFFKVIKYIQHWAHVWDHVSFKYPTIPAWLYTKAI